MTDLELRKLIDAGADRNEIEYIMFHSEIGEEFQNQLLSILARGDIVAYNSAIDELILRGIWDEDKDADGTLPPDVEEKINAVIDYVMSLEELPREITPQMQYLNLTYVMRHLFYNEHDILSVLTPTDAYTIRFQTDHGEKWEVTYDTDSLLTIDKRLEPFDFAVLDAIYTLHKNEFYFFSTKWIDTILTGSQKRTSTRDSLNRIDYSIEKLSYLNVQITINGQARERTPLLSLQKFYHHVEGNFYYLEKINDLYQYAAEMHQIANVPSEYFATSSLPKEFKFSDTETAIYIKRRIIARVMGIIRQSKDKHHGRQHWNRLSLIQAKETKYYDPKGRQKSIAPDTAEYQSTKKRGLFAELGLLPDIDNLSPDEQKEIMSKWRKTKADYMRVIRGTLEHLKRIYVILDYEEVRPNESKSLRDPVIAYDIICFTKTELNALNGMRDELKPAYVQNLLSKRHKKTGDANSKNG